jgi:hypothetical protein
MKKRGKKLLDYDKLRSNVKKMIEKPSGDPSKLTQVNSSNQGRTRGTPSEGYLRDYQ